MPLFQGTQQQYYGQQSFTWSGGSVLAATVTLTFPNNPTLLNNLATMPNAYWANNCD